ncbi:Pyruvate carboxylase, partial [hydrothermal vent metagenome]
AAATVLAAIDAGVDAVDAAMDSFSGLTSQPNLGSIVEALRNTERDTGIDPSTVRQFSDYWESVRLQYAAFEADLKAGASEVYLHEMPGGQFTNLKEQARSLGLSERWHEVAQTYADVNQMFGDIVKVTPSSKVVGDMTLAMVSAGLTRADVENPDKEISFPDSVVGFFKGELGQPPGGFPKNLQAKILKGETALTVRPGSVLPDRDLVADRKAATKAAGREITDEEFNSYLMYPKVFADFTARQEEYGPVSSLPTPQFFYGMKPGTEITVTIETGKTLVVRCLAIGETDDEGNVKVFFELNGQPRTAKVADRAAKSGANKHPKAEVGNPLHVAAPMPGVVSSLIVEVAQKVEAGDVLLTIEAMKMETAIHAEADGVVKKIITPVGTQIDAKDLMIELEV